MRRKGKPPVPYSIAEAEALCNTEEEAIARLEKALLAEENAKREADGLKLWTKSEMLTRVEPPVLENQIIEVQWFRAGLTLPPNVVLVDTPGNAQQRSGMRAAHTQTLGGTQGIAVDLEELIDCESFHHRARCGNDCPNAGN